MKPWIKMAAIFAAGFLLGGAASGLAIHHCFRHFGGGPPNSEAILKMLSSKLSLTAEQRDKVAALLKDHSPKMEALRNKTHDDFKAQREAFNLKLRPLLNPDQQKKLDEMTARWNKRESGKNCYPFGCGTAGQTPTVTGK